MFTKLNHPQPGNSPSVQGNAQHLSDQAEDKKIEKSGSFDAPATDHIRNATDNSRQVQQLKTYAHMANAGNRQFSGKTYQMMADSARVPTQGVIQRVRVKGIDTNQSEDFSLLDGLNVFELEQLHGKLKIESKDRPEFPERNQAWLQAARSKLLASVNQITQGQAINDDDRSILTGMQVPANAKIGKGVTKNVYVPNSGNKVYATPIKASNDSAGLLSEVIKLQRLRAAGLPVPNTYMGGFTQRDQGGFPQITVPKPQEENLAAQAADPAAEDRRQEDRNESLPVFAMDKVQGDSYDLWKKLENFQRNFIQEPKYLGLDSDTKAQLVGDMRRLLAYLQSHIIVDLQFFITDQHRLILLDPARIYDLSDPEDEQFLEKHGGAAMSTHQAILQKLGQGIEILERGETESVASSDVSIYLLSATEADTSFATVADCFEFLSQKCHQVAYSSDPNRLTMHDLQQIAELNPESDFVQMHLEADQLAKLRDKLGQPHAALNSISFSTL